MTEREFAINVVKRLQQEGYQARWAGGCVRDELLGLVPKDYDVATDARPEQVRQLFRRTIAVGMSFGVVEVIGPREGDRNLVVQVATFRSDVGYSDGRHPDTVVFSSPKEDALRRDFTINGMFFDPLRDELIDYVGGRDDLRNKILRAIGDPHQRFAEDKLRLLRAVRIATRFELEIEPATAAAIRGMADQIGVVSAERIADELRKLLTDRHRVRGVRLLDEFELIKPLLPELPPLKNFPHQQGLDLWSHTIRTLEHLPADASFPLALAALLHEIGRATLTEAQTLAERKAGALVASIADRLRLSNAETERMVWLIENQHALQNAPKSRPSKLKKLFIHPGITELLALYRAEALADGTDAHDVAFCEQLLQTWTENDINPPPLLRGDDLIALGLKPGPLFKEILDTVRDAQLDCTIRAKAEAIALAKRILSDREWHT
jgi:poly(A) polymerase